MGKRIVFIKMFLLFLIILPETGFGQTTPGAADTTRRGAVKIFLDCRGCDMNYIRQEITYINYVRDVREAQVYILETNQDAGSGGNQYTFTFQGQGAFNGMNDTLVFTSSPDQTSTIIREKRTNMLKMGLMRYVARTPLFNEIEINHNAGLEQEEVIDRWNNWVFELQTSPRFTAEESYSRLSFFNSINITKITPDIKLEIQVDQSTNRQRFFEDGEKTEYIRSEKAIENLFVKSLGNHWSAGLKWDLGASTSENYYFSTEFMPAIEYNIYPYSEATHQQFRLLYSAGYQFSNYIDTSILNKTKEGLFKHEIRVAYQVQEKWGSINVSLSGSNYFHDFSKNKLELNGFMRLRIIKGLSLSINGGVAYINDQLNLRKGDLTEAERLLRLKEQATSFSIQGGVSITYTFGSIYNNVVNPRFGNGGGGGGFDR
ncbi:MAG: hypothetical protein Q8N38_06580 [Bacteroidales bacterium]|nr:hypothetical protein [Bacteroidales bacterium]